MITLLTTLTLLFLIFFINYLVIKSTKTKFPINTDALNRRLTEKIRGAVAIVGIAIIVFSILYINLFYKSESEIFSEKKMKKELDKTSAKKLAAEKEIKRLDLTKKKSRY